MYQIRSQTCHPPTSATCALGLQVLVLIQHYYLHSKRSNIILLSYCASSHLSNAEILKVDCFVLFLIYIGRIQWGPKKGSS